MFNIDLNREIPSIKTKEFLSKSEKLFATPSLRAFPNLVTSEAKGCVIIDVDGNSYLDFAQSINIAGHSHPVIIKSIKEQIGKLMVGGVPGWALLEPRIKLAEKLFENVPGELKTKGRIAFCSSGTESCDYALKLARQTSQKKIILAQQGAYHGISGTTLTVTTTHSNLRKFNVPLTSEVSYIPPPNCYRCIFNQSPENCNLDCFKYLELMIGTITPPEDIAAMIIEPIQMHGGVIIPPENYMSKLIDFCNKNNILLIDDEVFTGFGKTGEFFAINHWGIEPDILCLGKAMGGGLPLGAVIAKEEVINGILSSNNSSSSSGNLFSCVASIENLKLISEERLLENATKMGSYIKDGFEDISKECALIGDVRGKGLLIGVELVKDPLSKEPAAQEAKIISEEAFKRGILISLCGVYDNVIRVTPPLVITEEIANRFLEIMGDLFQEF